MDVCFDEDDEESEKYLLFEKLEHIRQMIGQSLRGISWVDSSKNPVQPDFMTELRPKRPSEIEKLKAKAKEKKDNNFKNPFK